MKPPIAGNAPATGPRAKAQVFQINRRLGALRASLEESLQEASDISEAARKAGFEITSSDATTISGMIRDIIVAMGKIG